METLAPTILVVDDEESNITLLKEILQWAGYNTITASNGYEAVMAYITQTIDLTILDMMMPGLSGFETAQWIKHARPNARILLATGLRNINESHWKDMIVGLVFKPYNIDQIYTAVEDALNVEPKITS